MQESSEKKKKLFGRRLCGILSVCFMIFRSSPSLFRYLLELPKGSVTLSEFLDNVNFFSYTPKEDWGIWSFRVYLNQRHLAFGMGIVFMVLLIFRREGLWTIGHPFKKMYIGYEKRISS